ncbi:unnamed protein product [Caretta caretta]
MKRSRSFNCLLSCVSDFFEEEGTKFVILRHQTFNEAQVTSDSAYGANRESLSAFVENFETSISIDFPEDEEYVGEVLDCGSSDISIHGRTEEAQHADEKDDRNSSIPEVVITQANEELMLPTSCLQCHLKVRTDVCMALLVHEEWVVDPNTILSPNFAKIKDISSVLCAASPIGKV